MSKPFLIPKSKDYDENKTGFYTLKNSTFNNLRVQNSDIELDGIIRLNKNNNNQDEDSEYVFEGFNGKKWVQFNALKGETGDNGKDFNSKLEFVNCVETPQNMENNGLIFKTNTIDTNQSNQINIRSLSSKGIDYNNGQMLLNTIKITTQDNEINLESIPQPYNWDISNLSIKEMKSSPLDNNVFKCYGDIITIKIKSSVNIEKGQFVSLDEEDGYLVSKPYNNNGILNYYSNPTSLLGVALENSINNEKIKVCRNGITTVKYNTNSQMVDDNLMDIGKVDAIGCKGFLSNNGYVFCSPVKPGLGIDYCCVGEFLETNSSNDYYLFKINLQ